ncbi:hypothetical protein SAY87_004501 [Trapa incisa]|uniref:TF-B3 domain-containing protein n=1 Tax=Trapa incisa TaxID=236973 RepID=A0AAN7JP05_9MYRT|nr:hypothetical protein SAY87_004501 [Trapa incisa]
MSMPSRENIPMLTGKRQKFFKVFLMELSSRRMKIPPAFRRHMKDKSYGSVYLMGPSGNSWTVKLIEEGSQLYLTGGWPTFVKDNGIQNGHFLVFEYNGAAEVFEVTVFNPSGCEEKAALCATPSRAGNSNHEEPVKMYGNGMNVKAEGEASRGPGGYYRHLWLTSLSVVNIGISFDLLIEKVISTQPKVSTWTYPSFVVHLRAYNVEERPSGTTVAIPCLFFRTHMSHFVDLTTRVHLLWDNKKWPATVTIRRNRVYLSEGWLDFVRETKVRVGDSCKFELLGPHLLHVRILKFW